MVASHYRPIISRFVPNMARLCPICNDHIKQLRFSRFFFFSHSFVTVGRGHHTVCRTKIFHSNSQSVRFTFDRGAVRPSLYILYLELQTDTYAPSEPNRNTMTQTMATDGKRGGSIK